MKKNSTGVYIGELIRPKKAIEEDDQDDAHLDPEAEEIIRYIHATEGHEYIVEKTLSKAEGLTHEVFEPYPELEGEVDESKPLEEMTDEEKDLLKKK